MARVIRIGPGVYDVIRPGGDDAAGSRPGTMSSTWPDRAATCGRFPTDACGESAEPPREASRARAHGAVQSLTSPMPATVVKVLATAGQAVKAGDTLVIVEAMKMELPVRAPSMRS